jgi:hypothetical protein
MAREKPIAIPDTDSDSDPDTEIFQSWLSSE